MIVPKYPVKIHISVFYEMKKELKQITKERGFSVAELVRYWLRGNIEY